MLSKDLKLHREVNQRFMKDNVALISAINTKVKEKHTLMQHIRICQRGLPNSSADEAIMNEQRKELEIQDITIMNFKQEIEQLELENEQLRMRRPN